ncbi:metalloregulator ArsR/SmtB family transcription factor [Wielerella bovis]|uniref:ArsR/SmtB family transcription factor n=1 Tax=Wielerella bovis TaxID=2917790 RepID=UPI0020199D9B|nr:metalloregulator ArsR/SmtB family transcription factor [Wielerella bovis]ULJ69962.1 metalloregulator ArsR/SmtB family transcription factor [Wielerella bovis]
MNNATKNPTTLQEHAQIAADFLKTIGNATRLQILCLLAERGEMCVMHLHEHLDLPLSQSALSQHLSKMRTEGILSSRQDAQKMYYQICDDKTLKLIHTLKEIFCP